MIRQYRARPQTLQSHMTPSPDTTGLLLVNLGTPDAPTSAAVRRYLAEFLADPRVIEIPPFLWKLILHGIILRVRPKKSAALYQSIWTDEGSPLLTISRQQQVAIQQQLGDKVRVKLGMRYGNPSIASALREFQDEGIERIIIFPLYPQYAAPTTGTVFDAVARELMNWRRVPALTYIDGYFDNSFYLAALSNSIREHINQHGVPQKIIFSYHGMPKRNYDLGDPYYDFCTRTTALVAEQLGLTEDICLSTFQSRFGYAEWLQPYTDKTLEALPASGVKNIAILSPAFSADCLETLEELAVENRETFMHAGGENYHYIPALNDRADHIHALVDVIKQKL